MRRINKKLWIPVAAIALCLVAVAVVCIVLFAGKRQGGHLKIEDGVGEVRGELSVSLVRERLERTLLDEYGFLATKKDEKPKDFSSSKANIFEIETAGVVAPGCRFAADMAISNAKPYAFEYWIEIVILGGDPVLADRWELTVKEGGRECARQTLRGGLTTGVVARVDSGEISRFTASLEYLQTENADDTKNKTLSFDLTVHARLI